MERFIFQLTVSEFMELMNQQKTNVPIVPEVRETKMLYSIKELADFLNCSIVTAQKIKNSGAIPFSQTGRKCVFDGGAILAALANKKKGQRA